MGRLVANLLDMIRVEAGALQVQKEWQLLSDVVGVALLRTEEQLRDHPVTTRLPGRPAAGADGRDPAGAGVRQPARERRQAHAGRHADRGRRRRAQPGEVVAYVADRGPGLPPGRGGADLPEVLSRRRAGAGGHRPRPHHLPRHRHRARRADLGRERGRAAARSSGSRSRSPAAAALAPRLVTEPRPPWSGDRPAPSSS